MFSSFSDFAEGFLLLFDFGEAEAEVGRPGGGIGIDQAVVGPEVIAECTLSTGPFRYKPGLPAKQRQQLATLAKFYSPDMLLNVLLPLIEPKCEPVITAQLDTSLSLRALDYLVTNYAKKYRPVYKVVPKGKTYEMSFNLYNEYHSWLNNYGRRTFDTFRRRQRVYFRVDVSSDYYFATTAGQLYFVYFAYLYSVLDYARAHIRDIETDMATATKEHLKAKAQAQLRDGVKRRRQLSQTPNVPCFVYDMRLQQVCDPDQAPTSSVIPSATS